MPIFLIYKSDQLNSLFFKKFQKIFNTTFSQNYDYKIFKWKYIDYFSSNSIIQEILLDNKPIGYRGLWKVKNYPIAYQCIDTCILPDFQGRGIFKLSNQHIVDNLGSFYNYPNSISRPGYIKSGWVEESKMKIYINRLENFEFCNWDEDFLDWRFVRHPYIKYYKAKIRGGYAILRFKKNLPIHIESTRINLKLEEIKNPFFSFKYDLKKNGIKVKNAGSVLTYNFKGKLRSSYFDMI